MSNASSGMAKIWQLGEIIMCCIKNYKNKKWLQFVSVVKANTLK